MDGGVTLARQYQNLRYQVGILLRGDGIDNREVAITLHDILLRLELWGKDTGEEDGIRPLDYVEANNATMADVVRARLKHATLSVEMLRLEPEPDHPDLLRYDDIKPLRSKR